MMTIVVPTRDRNQQLQELFRSIGAAERSRRLEMIVVDDASAQPVDAGALRLQGVAVRVIRNERREGAARSRNLGAQEARGDVLGFLDDDAEVLPNWFLVAERELARSRRMFTGRILPLEYSMIGMARQARYDRRFAGLGLNDSVSFFAGGNSVVDRSLFEQVGGFPDLPVASDNALVRGAAERGERCYFIHDLCIRHHNGKGVAEAVRNAFLAGVAKSAVPGDERPVWEELWGVIKPAQRSEFSILQAINAGLQMVHLSGVACGRYARRGARAREFGA